MYEYPTESVKSRCSIASSKKTSFASLPVLTGLFAATLLISNVLNCKVIRVGALAFTGGLIMFPLAALLGEVLTEVYGYAESRKVIWTGLGSLVLFAVMIEICGALPADPLSTRQAAYDVILGGVVPGIVAASLIAYLIGEFSNSYVLAKCKIRTHGELHVSAFRGALLANTRQTHLGLVLSVGIDAYHTALEGSWYRSVSATTRYQITWPAFKADATFATRVP